MTALPSGGQGSADRCCSVVRSPPRGFLVGIPARAGSGGGPRGLEPCGGSGGRDEAGATDVGWSRMEETAKVTWTEEQQDGTAPGCKANHKGN